jgi:malonate-semialdehyde dehydrogenase (acetylating)/methylmalonate-semialdehyde dehydrogenase
MKLVPHWINGAEIKGSGSRFGEVFDPALGIQSAQVAFAEAADIEVAVASAQAAFPAWKDTSLAKRNSIIFNFRQLLDQRTGELAEIITSRWLDPSHGGINLGFPQN